MHARKGKIWPKVAKNAKAILPAYMMLAFDCTISYGFVLKIVQVLMR